MKISMRVNFMAKLKDGILYMASIILLSYLYTKLSDQVIVASSIELFYYGLTLAIAFIFGHLLCQYLAFFITSKIILEAVSTKKKVPSFYILLPLILEMVADVLLLYVWNELFKDWVYLKNGLLPLTFVVILRLLNNTIETYIQMYRKKRGKGRV